MADADRHDLIVVGGGPVGLYAALKAAVLNHSVLVLDKGRRYSRISQAAAIANLPGQPGITGPELLERARQDLRDFEKASGKRLVTLMENTEAVHAERAPDGDFVVHARPTGSGEPPRRLRAPVLLLATGLVDRKPGIERFEQSGHHTLSGIVHRGEVGYCLLCEGWAVEGKQVAVVGATADSVSIAQDLAHHFDAQVTLLTHGAHIDAQPSNDVVWEDRPIRILDEAPEGLRVVFEDGDVQTYDKAFVSYGWYKVNNELAAILGAALTSEGYVRTDDNAQAIDRNGGPVRGLFAVGDLRAGRWKQIVIGWGDAETAVITAYAEHL